MFYKVFLKKTGLLSAIFVAFCFQLCGQGSSGLSATLPGFREKIYLHVDKSVYVPGEIIWFKADVVDASTNKPTSVSRISYIEVLDDQNNPVLQGKVGLDDGSGNGAFMLPSSLKTGSYIIRAYTALMKNFSPANYFHQSITVINPLALAENNLREGNQTHENAFAPAKMDGVGLEITGIMPDYHLRSKVTAKLTGIDSTFRGKLSVSVYLTDALQPNVSIEAGWILSEGTNDEKGLPQSEVLQLPETEGLLIAGKYFPAPGKKVSGFISAPGKHYKIGQALSDENGQILFNVPLFFGRREIIFQTLRSDSNFKIQIDDPYSKKFADHSASAVVLDSSQLKALAVRSIFAQLPSLSLAEGDAEFTLPNTYDSTLFYGHSSISYNLDDYTRFKTMEEVMREYVKEVRVRNQNGRFNFKVYDETTKLYFDNDPLVLLDGVQVNDINKIIATDPLQVQRIDIVARRFFIGDTDYDGIINYRTYDENPNVLDLDPNALVLEYEGLQFDRQFVSPSYPDENARKSRFPDYRNQLFWSPDLKTGGDSGFSFYTSDVPGTYNIIVQGISKDGKFVRASRSFKVLPSR